MLSDKKFFLLDMDGTIYLDEDLFDGALDFLNKIEAKGAKYLFVTNNSSKSVEDYVKKVNKLGIKATADNFFTSTDATVHYIHQNYPDVCFYCVGTTSFVDQLKKNGIRVTTELSDEIGGVLLSNDQELSFKKLEDACYLLTKGVKVYIATNPDWVCPTAFGYVPDCGSFAWMIEKACGKSPEFIGKPKPDILLLALSKYGYTRKESVMIGDRVYTDIASGYNAGIDTCFVLSGEGTYEDATNSDTKPTYIFDSVKDIIKEI